MNCDNLLIGSGYYATTADDYQREAFFQLWLKNTQKASARIVVVDNSETALDDYPCRIIRVWNNLGHACSPPNELIGTPLLGWSMSWIIPAMIAYSERCDFIYKEQDCLAFGDWLPIVRVGMASIGRNSIMPCEQSLFYIKHEFILPFVRDYLLLGHHDATIVTEDKFKQLKDSYGGAIEFHNLPGGRDRPLPDITKPFYAQKLTESEMNELRDSGLV